MKAVYRAVNLKYMWKNWGLQRILVEFRNEIECALQKSIWSTVLIKTTFFKFEISSLSRGKPLAMKTVYRATNLKKGKIKLGYVLDTSGVPKCNRMCITESNWKVFKLMHSVKKNFCSKPRFAHFEYLHLVKIRFKCLQCNLWPQIWNPLATDGRTAHTLNFLDGAVWARCLKGLIKFSLKVFNESLGPYETPYFSHESFSQTSVDSERKYQPTLEQSGQMC